MITQFNPFRAHASDTGIMQLCGDGVLRYIQKSGFAGVGFLSRTRFYVCGTRITTNLSHRNDVNYL